jgi:hypothetical protein
MDDTFNANALKLRPEQLKRLKPAKASVSKPERRKREFIQITHEQSERLDKANHAAEIVFRYLLFLNWKSPGRTIYLANGALSEKGVSRFAKCRALDNLKKLGLVRLKKRPHKSPGVIVR